MNTNKLVIITKEKPNLENYTSGQEYYLHTMISLLKKLGYRVQVLSEKEFFNNNFPRGAYIHLYYVPLKTIIWLKWKKQNNLCFHVYHLEDEAWSVLTKMKWKAAVFLAQFLVNKFLVTSRSLEEKMKKLGVKESKMVRVDPYYSCSCGSFKRIRSLIQKRFNNILSGKPIKILYLGRYNPKRLPLKSLIRVLKEYSERQRVQLKIVSTSKKLPVFRKNIKGSFSIEFVSGYLTEKLKCDIYRKADFFLYLTKGNVAMNPPITVLEAVYHGTLPIVTPSVLGDLDIPEELVVGSAQGIPSFLNRLFRENKVRQRIEDGLSKFNYFYDKSRYINSIKDLVSWNEEELG